MLSFHLDFLCLPCFGLLLCLFGVFSTEQKEHPRALRALMLMILFWSCSGANNESDKNEVVQARVQPIWFKYHPHPVHTPCTFQGQGMMVLIFIWAWFWGEIQHNLWLTPRFHWEPFCRDLLVPKPKTSLCFWWEFTPELLKVFSFHPFQPWNVSWDCRVINGKTRRHPVCKIYELILILAIPWIETSLQCRNPPKMLCSALLLTQHFIDPRVCATWMMDYLISDLAVFI